jgi:hypothetical protein
MPKPCLFSSLDAIARVEAPASGGRAGGLIEGMPSRIAMKVRLHGGGRTETP